MLLYILASVWRMHLLLLLRRLAPYFTQKVLFIVSNKISIYNNVSTIIYVRYTIIYDAILLYMCLFGKIV
jgi:hypothetical protein